MFLWRNKENNYLDTPLIHGCILLQKTIEHCFFAMLILAVVLNLRNSLLVKSEVPDF